MTSCSLPRKVPVQAYRRRVDACLFQPGSNLAQGGMGRALWAYAARTARDIRDPKPEGRSFSLLLGVRVVIPELDVHGVAVAQQGAAQPAARGGLCPGASLLTEIAVGNDDALGDFRQAHRRRPSGD